MTNPDEVHPTAYHVVMSSFEGLDTAARVLAELKAEKALEGCEIEGDALISRDAAGQIHFSEKGSAGVGATLGAVTAGMLGLVGGPLLILVMVVAGGVAGGIAGHFAGQLLPPEDLREVGASLTPGSSAFIALVDTAHADAVADAFAAKGAKVINVAVETGLSSVIREGITHHIRRV